MKLKALRGFWMMDKKRGVSVARKIGEEFTVDEAEEGELIYGMLAAGRATVVDEKFIPLSWRYVCTHSFTFQNVEGLPVSCSVGKEMIFSQDQACKYLVNGYIRPVDESGWTPKKLLGSIVKEATIKQMFDDLPKPKESWVMKEGR